LALQERDAAGELPLRVFAYLRDEPRCWELVERLGFRWRGAGGRLTLMGIKFFADGALGSHGAAMLCPYCNEPGRLGLTLMDAEQLGAAISRCEALGVQSATHAIGDAANRCLIAAIAAAQRPENGLRHRVEHAQIMAPEDFSALANCGAIASMQPVHGTSDMPWAEEWIGAERLRGAYAWRKMLANSIPLALGSDAPVEPVSPLLGLHAAIRGEDATGRSPKPWLAAQTIGFDEALAGFTSGAAFAVHEEERLGRLLPGFAADLTLLSADPRATKRGWLDVEVVGTVVDGSPTLDL
jgi:predicted amidohydrolase YtcJ